MKVYQRMLTAAILSILCIYSCTASWVNVKSNITDRVVHIESMRYRGLWADCYNLPTNSFYGSREEDVYYSPRTQYKVVDCGGEYVCLESLYRPTYFLYPARVSTLVGVWNTYHPQSNDWAKWKIECKSADMTECRFYTPRLNNYMYSGYQYFLQTGRYVDSKTCHFRILAPAPADQFVTLLQTENYSNVQQTKTLTMSEGVTDTTSSTYKVSQAVATEIGSAFGIISDAATSSSLSTEWQTTTSKTFQQSTQLTYDLVIPAKTKITFQQLVGVYGPFNIAAKKFKILSEKLN